MRVRVLVPAGPLLTFALVVEHAPAGEVAVEHLVLALDLLAGIGNQVCWLADTCLDILDRDERERENTLTDDLEEVSYSAGCVLCESAEELRDVVDDMESRSAQHTAKGRE